MTATAISPALAHRSVLAADAPARAFAGSDLFRRAGAAARWKRRRAIR